MGMTFGPIEETHASESCAEVAPRFSAMALIASTIAILCLKYSSLWRRVMCLRMSPSVTRR